MIYFDNSATTKIYPESLDSYVSVSQNYFGNPSSLHELGTVTSQLLEHSRKQIANELRVKPNEIYFTSGGSEGDNWVIKGTALEKSFYGKHIITTKIEHPAVLNTMSQLEKEGFEVTYLSVNSNGVIDLEELKAVLRKDTILVSIIAVNNEIGTIQPLEEIGQILQKYPTVHFHIDAVQAHYIDLNLDGDSRIDMAVFSSHKFHGPRGVGFVYIKEGKNVTPLIHGGGQEQTLRSGTENLPAIAAMAKSYRLHQEKAKQLDLDQLTNKIRNHINNFEDIVIFSPENGSPHVLCFGIKNVRGEVTVHAFEKYDIFLSTTSACSSKSSKDSSTLIAMGIPHHVAETAVRASLSTENTEAEVDTFLNAFDNIYKEFEIVRKS